MKNYPRIHSLSTLGLIHHQDNDYQFHPTRTDFMGDSASGKSIIADLLQLIFVGSTAFKSATVIMKGKREPDGLVLRTSGKGMNIAYAFINIEVANEQYVVIGAYFESTSKQTKPFIIQSSTKIEDEKLVPMLTPLKSADFKYEGDVCSLEELPDLMEDKGLIFKKWERISSYHRILYTNNILPLDLAANDKTLNDYAKIIQSFSRGKTLDIKDSKSLLDFLFGKDSGKEIYKKYLETVKDLESTVLSYGQNLEAINLLSKKYSKVCLLQYLLRLKNNKEKEYLKEELFYLQYKYNSLNASIRYNIEKYQIASLSLKMLIAVAEKDILIAQKEKTNIDEGVVSAFDKYSNAKSAHDLLIKAESLLSKFNIEKEELDALYNIYQRQKEQYFILQELRSQLSIKSLESFFEQSEWMRGFIAGNEYFNLRISEINPQLEQFDLLIKFSDINDPQSLVRWAISLNRPLTLEEESLIIYFQTYKREKPENAEKGSRFLPLPETLFKNKIIDVDHNGFWIDLGGVFEYIDYVQERKLNTVNKDMIEEYFKSFTANIQNSKRLKETEKKNLIDLNKILLNLSSPSEAINIYKQKEELKDFKEIEELNIGLEEFKSYLSCLQKYKAIKSEFQSTRKLYDRNVEIQKEIEQIIKRLPIVVQRSKDFIENIEKKESSILQLSNDLSENTRQGYELDFYISSDDKVDTFQIEFEELKKDIELIDQIKVEQAEFYDISQKRTVKFDDYVFRYKERVETDDSSATEKSVQEKNIDYTNANANYEAEFNSIVNDFLPNEKYRFEKSKDFLELISYLLPDIFGNENIIETEIIQKIENHLHKINNKNRDLNSKKVRKIENLLDDVFSSISSQADVVRKINRFFDDDEKRITGNHRLKLEHKNSERFPIKWLTDFKTKASDQLGLFESSIADKLSFSISIEEKIVKAFQELTDQRSNGITVEQLLDPNSYLELNLEMQNSSGRSNKGSTGQTYAAIALLCIARLSIVGNKNLEKGTSGLRFMPIDEAEGLGTNFDMLNDIAQKYDYQTITFSINPLGRYDDQFIYILHQDPYIDEEINYTPMAIFSKADISDDLLKIKI